MGTKKNSSGSTERPSPPSIGIKRISKQFWLDIFGKEVQEAATYSYLWMAAQAGHVALGMMAQLIFFITFTLLFKSLPIDVSYADECGLILAALIVFIWELFAYLASVKEATDRFPLDRRTLFFNALTATVYMWIGSVISYGFLNFFKYGFYVTLLIISSMLAISFVIAIPWLRQKIIWQKAALPYLFRLANAKPTIRQEDADIIQNFIDNDISHSDYYKPKQFVVYGPVGAGRTSLVAGIGTELAFKKYVVRYCSFDKLAELARLNKTYDGPSNINYWDWRKAQILIIDDASSETSVIAAKTFRKNQSEQRQLISENIENHRLTIEAEKDAVKVFEGTMEDSMESAHGFLQTRHTIWVLGNVPNPESWIKVINKTCNSQQKPIEIRLEGIIKETKENEQP